MKKMLLTAGVALLLLLTFTPLQAQSGIQTLRMAEGFVRIAEPGQLADTLTVWGDVSSPGRYIVPRGTKPHELIGYARGPQSRIGGNNQEVALDWSKLRLELSISTYNPERGTETVQSYQFRYSEPFPAELRSYALQNEQIVSLEVKRRPSIRDYLNVMSPIISITLSSILLIDRLQN